MTPSRRLLFARASTPLAQCARLMRAGGCRHLPVVGDEAAAAACGANGGGGDGGGNGTDGNETKASGDGRKVIGALVFYAR
jgi:hypothetical protein